MPVLGVEGSGTIGPHPVTESVAEGDRCDEVTPMLGTTAPVEIAAFAGSLRAASWARALLRATRRVAARQRPAHHLGRPRGGPPVQRGPRKRTHTLRRG